MKILRYPEALKAEIVETETPGINENQALAKSIVCNVSAGTELAFYRGVSPQLNSKAGETGLWESAPGNLGYPMQSNNPGCWWMGYACVAEVVEVGRQVDNLKVGDIVFTGQGHKEYQVINDNFLKLPEGVGPEAAAFLTLTQIAFNGILDAHIKLMDNVVILGMGTIGQLLLQMAKMSGCNVIAVDLVDKRLDLASKLGADLIVNPGRDGDTAQNVLKFFGRGADAVLEVTGNSKALHDAVRCVCKDGQVTVLSFYQQPPANFEMGREFHHNRVTIRSSQIGGIDPKLRHHYDRSRRAETSLKLIEKMDVESLISHRCQFEDYPKMLEVIDKHPENCQSVIIKY